MRMFLHIVLGLMLLHAPLLGVADNAQDNQVSATIAVEQSFEVGANDSVWGIASKIAKDEVEVRRIMALLFEQNTQQFIDGDINRLKIGSILTLRLTDSIEVSTVNGLSVDLSRQAEPKKSVSKAATLDNKVFIRVAPIEQAVDQSFLNNKTGSKKSSIQEPKLEENRSEALVLNKALNEQSNKGLVSSQNEATSLIEAVELSNDELQASSQRIKALDSSLANKNQVIDSQPKPRGLAPIDTKLVGSADAVLLPQTSHDRKDFMAVITVSTLAVLLVVFIIARSGIRTRPHPLVASEPAHSATADAQPALAGSLEHYIDEFLDEDVVLNAELEIADAPTEEPLLYGSDSEPPMSKTKLPFISATSSRGGLDQPVTAASVDLSDLNNTATQLQLSRVYIDMGDLDGAKIMLEKVLETADSQQLAIANDLISELEQLS